MNVDDDNTHKRDAPPAGSNNPPPHKKQATLDEDLAEMRAAMLQQVRLLFPPIPCRTHPPTHPIHPTIPRQPEGTAAMELTTNDASDSDEDVDDLKKYLKPPTAPQHVRIGDDFQAAVPTLGNVDDAPQQQHDENLHSRNNEPHEQHLPTRAEAFHAGRVSFDEEEDGMGTGSRAYREMGVGNEE